MQFLVRSVFAAFLLLSLSGCFFDHPLTGGPSKGSNTWLLGVWESKDDKGRTSRIMVTPINSDRYAMALTVPGASGKETRKYEFEAWPSRVGSTLFLTLRCLTSPGDIPAGGYVFTQIQLLDQNHAKAHGLNLESARSASSYELRQEIRLKLADRSLYEGTQHVKWTRVAEIFWSTDGSDPVFTPLRNPINDEAQADKDAAAALAAEAASTPGE